MRMPFGINCAEEVFQKRISQLLGDLPGVPSILQHEETSPHNL